MQYLDAGSIHDFKPGTTRRIEAGKGKRILVCRVDDAVYAVDDRCTHEDASLYLGCLKGDRIHCSLHGGEFNVRTGEAVTEPAEVALQTYVVTLEQGNIRVAVPSG